jgi:hypothetical protein
MISLGLKPKDTTHTTVPQPKNHAGLEVNKWAPQTLGFRLFTAVDMGDNPDVDYGIRVHYGLVPAGVLPTGQRPSATRLTDDYHVLSSPPLSGADLPDSFFTRRKQDLLKNLPAEASGMTCYLCPCYENSKGREPGPWGTMVQAIVP